MNESGPCGDEWYEAFQAAVDETFQKALDAVMPPKSQSVDFQVGDRIEVTGTRFDGTYEVTSAPEERPKPWEMQRFTSRRVADDETATGGETP